MKPREPQVTAPEPSAEEVVFEGFLRTRGLKVTRERQGILRAILARQDHVDADTLVEQLRGSGVSRATIYRTLDLLVQCGLVRRHNLGSNHAVYEASYGQEHHDHLVCLDCGRVIEFHCPDLEALQDSVCERHRFRPHQHNLQIFGVCEACQPRFDPQTLPEKLARLHP